MTVASTEIALDLLPTEILVKIFGYLDAEFIIENVGPVCRHFAAIASDPAVWRLRVQKEKGLTSYPPLEPLEEHSFSWMDACVAIEEQDRLWANGAEAMKQIRIPNCHYSSVDAVLVTQGLAISGSRDRSMNVWTVEQLAKGDVEPTQKMADAHTGWVWSLSCNEKNLISGAWDQHVYLWSHTPTGLEKTNNFNCRTAVLCTGIDSKGVVAVGTFDKTVQLFDARTKGKKLGSYCYHRKPVLSLAMTDDFVISASEDHSVAVFDRRIKKKLTVLKIFDDAFPMSLSIHRNMLYIGDKKGSLHLLDLTNGSFEVVKTFDSVHNGKVTGIHCSDGSVITCSTDTSLKVHKPDMTMKNMYVETFPDEGEVATMSVDEEGRVMTGFANNAVNVFLPQ